MRDISESDWKKYRELHPILLDRYCQLVLEEVGSLCTKAERNNHHSYLNLYRIIEQRDREMGQLFDNPKRSTAILQIMAINARGLFTQEEFSRFSQDIQGFIARFRS